MKLAGAAMLLCAAALAVPATAQTAEQDYQAGVAARHSGDPEEALLRLERAVQAEPENSDIHLQIGFAHLAMGDLDAAEAAFRRTLDLAHDYEDAKLGLARVADRRADGAAAARPWRWRVDLDGSYSEVDRQADWQSATLLVQHRPGANTTLGMMADATHRFDRTDIYGEARVDYRFGFGGNVYALIGGTRDADHRPEWQFGAGAGFRLHGGPYATILRLDIRQAAYPAGDAQTVSPGLEQYLTGRAWITAQWINVWDRFAHSSGWLVRGDVMPNDRLRLFAGAADAPDLDAGLVIRTHSLFGGVAMDVGDHFTLRLSLAHDDPEGPADRDTLAFGLGYRF